MLCDPICIDPRDPTPKILEMLMKLYKKSLNARKYKNFGRICEILRGHHSAGAILRLATRTTLQLFIS